MYAQLGSEIQEIVRTRAQAAYTQPLWWCPFCDCSNQFVQDLSTGGARPCGKCGATVLLSKPEPVMVVHDIPKKTSALSMDNLTTAITAIRNAPLDRLPETPEEAGISEESAPTARPRGLGPIPKNRRGNR